MTDPCSLMPHYYSLPSGLLSTNKRPCWLYPPSSRQSQAPPAARSSSARWLDGDSIIRPAGHCIIDNNCGIIEMEYTMDFSIKYSYREFPYFVHRHWAGVPLPLCKQALNPNRLSEDDDGRLAGRFVEQHTDQVNSSKSFCYKIQSNEVLGEEDIAAEGRIAKSLSPNPVNRLVS